MTSSESTKTSSRFPITTPLIAAAGLGVCVFLPWLEGSGVSLNAMDVSLDSIWSDLVDVTMDGVWLGVVLLTVAVFGFIAALVKAVPASVCRVLGVIAVVLVGMFFRALVAADGFEFIEFGAFGAAGFSLFMLAPRR
ncbi:MAG: hypothetical protein HZA58_01795 [Acidimicrobiia bacterium]|nr:hypothetical protein [Acidimicrobiia bacterium]